MSHAAVLQLKRLLLHEILRGKGQAKSTHVRVLSVRSLANDAASERFVCRVRMSPPENVCTMKIQPTIYAQTRRADAQASSMNKNNMVSRTIR